MKSTIQIVIFSLAMITSLRAATWHQWDATTGGNGHFYSVTDTALTWFDAKGAATTAGGYLTSIGSIEELNFIRTTFGRSELFWTGLSTVNSAGAFTWDNGEAVTFTYFGAHQPGAAQTSAVIINNLNSRGFTRGFFYDVPLGTNPLYRGIIENNTNPNAQNPGDGEPENPPGERVPDGGATAMLLGAALLATSLWRKSQH